MIFGSYDKVFSKKSNDTLLRILETEFFYGEQLNRSGLQALVNHIANRGLTPQQREKFEQILNKNITEPPSNTPPERLDPGVAEINAAVAGKYHTLRFIAKVAEWMLWASALLLFLYSFQYLRLLERMDIDLLLLMLAGFFKEAGIFLLLIAAARLIPAVLDLIEKKEGDR
jgi:hypothetical protein